MKLSYNKSLKIVGLSLVPLSRLVPDQWFNSYKIISSENWDSPASKVKVYPVKQEIDPLLHFSLQQLIESPECIELLTRDLNDHDILIGRPSGIPNELAGRKIIMLDARLGRQFENKATLRRQFGKELPFPEYHIYELTELNDIENSYQEVMNNRSEVIIQASVSSGGKGTFIVRDETSFKDTIEHLKISEAKQVVVSDLIKEADEVSLQACITKDDVIIGPLQRQIINDDILCNPGLQASEKFCGGIIDLSDQTTTVCQEAKTLTQLAAKKLRDKGYRGIFGVDFLFKDKKLYVLEINARPTGLTHLLSALDLPLLLLHILDLGSYEYRITDRDNSLKDSGGMFILHSKSNTNKVLKDTPVSGTFHIENGKLKRLSTSVDFTKIGSTEFILQNYHLPGTVIMPGGRLVRLMFKGKTMDKSKKVLYNEVQQTIRIVEKNIILN